MPRKFILTAIRDTLMSLANKVLFKYTDTGNTHEGRIEGKYPYGDTAFMIVVKPPRDGLVSDIIVQFTYCATTMRCYGVDYYAFHAVEQQVATTVGNTIVVRTESNLVNVTEDSRIFIYAGLF